eukprot:1918675-Prymnesium_polylepis.1
MAANRLFDRGTPIATRSRVTVARDGALRVGALLLSSWQTFAAATFIMNPIRTRILNPYP